MAKNFPMAKLDDGTLAPIISGATRDASGHEVRFSTGAEQVVLFLRKIGFTGIID